jgi:WD40 repeat protein
METIKVLLFAANPPGTAPLDLAREFREIDEEVRMSPYRSAVELILVPGTRPVDLLRKLNEKRPQVIHFSSHGNPDEILLESDDPEADASGSSGSPTRGSDERDMTLVRPHGPEMIGVDQGRPRGLSKSALVSVLRACDEGNLQLVVLNACHTRSQAEALTEIVDCVVSMARTITDRAAIKFAASFYGALAFGRSVRNAFEQGVARLSAEGIGETDTPELLVRAGVAASRIVLVGAAPRPAAAPTAEAPFLVPFPRNGDFVGRDGDLARLRDSLTESDARPVGIRPAGLTGMGGVGKTQLAVEYVYRHREEYPDGIFWIDAAGPLADGFARLATDSRLRWAEPDRPRDEQIRSAFAALDGRPHALLVLDNLPDPSAIAAPLLPGCIPEDLRCRLVFTTRRHDLGRFEGVEVTILPEEPALRLLLRHPSRRAALDPGHPDHEHARAIARMLGRLPLALELAGAYLGKYGGEVSLSAYRDGLKSDGALATLDADAAELSEADLRRVHDPAVAATIGEQWGSLRDDPARLLLRVASLFPESSAIPIARLGLLAGLGGESRPGRLSPLLRAVKCLDDACLIERLEAEQIRLHPLIREFAAGQARPEPLDVFRRRCLQRAVESSEQFTTLASLVCQRGVDTLIEDLISIVDLFPESSEPDLGPAPRHSSTETGDGRSDPSRGEPDESGPERAGMAEDGNAAVAPALEVRDSPEGGRPEMPRLTRRFRSILSRLFLILGNRPEFGGFEAIPARSPSRREGATAIAEPGARLQAVLRLLQREADHLQPVLLKSQPSLLPQQVRNRATLMGIDPLKTGAEAALAALGQPFFRLLWKTSHESPALVRKFNLHRQRVTALALTPDGRLALSASFDGTLRLWDTRSGRHQQTFPLQEDLVTSVAVALDGRHGLSNSFDGRLRLWDLQTGRLLRIFAPHDSSVLAVAVTPDGRGALSGANDGVLRLWDLATGRFRRAFAGHDGPLSAVAVTPVGRHALSASHDHTLKLWDLASGRLLRDLPGHEDRVNAIAIGPDGCRAVSASSDFTLRFWDLAQGQAIGTYFGHVGEVNAVAMTSDGRHALSGSSDRTVALWDLSTGRLARVFHGHEQWVTTVAASPDGHMALSGGFDGALALWDLRITTPRSADAGHNAQVTGLAVTPDGRHVVSASHDRTLKLWDLATGRPLWTFTGHKTSISAVAVTPDGRKALSGSYDLSLKLWDLATAESLRVYLGHNAWVTSVAVTADGRKALSGSYDGTVRLWDVETAQLLHIFLGHDGAVTAIAVGPNDRHLLSATKFGTMKIWGLADTQYGNVMDAQTDQTVDAHDDRITALAVTPDGQQALSASEDGTIKLWDLSTARLRGTFVGHDAGVSAIAVTPDGRHLLSASADRTLRLWDLQQRVCRGIIPLEIPLWHLALVPSGHAVVVGDGVGNILHFGIFGG